MTKPAHRPDGKSKNRGRYKVQVVEVKVPEIPKDAEFCPISSAPEPSKKQDQSVPRRLPVNGKSWKSPQSKRSSAIHRSKKVVSWERKQKLREARRAAQEQQRMLQEMEREERREERRRREQRRKQKEENEMKSASFQVIRDPSKIKKMSRKQLRYIQKADV